MSRGGHDLAHSALLQFLGEGALAPPGDVLAAVVGQHLLGRAVAVHRRPEDLHHQGARLAGVQPVADQEAAVIVHEGHQVDAAVLPLQDEGEQVGLPQLVGAGALEVANLVGMGASGGLLGLVAGLMQDAGDGLGAGGQGGAAQQQGADLLDAPVGVGLLHHEDGASGHLGQAAAGRGAAGPVLQAGGSLLLELAVPGVQSMLGDADQGGEVAGGQAAASPGVQQQQALLRGERRGRGLVLPDAAAPPGGVLKAGRAGRGFVGRRLAARVFVDGIARIYWGWVGGWCGREWGPGFAGGFRECGVDRRLRPVRGGGGGKIGHRFSLLAAGAAGRERRIPAPISRFPAAIFSAVRPDSYRLP